MSEDELEALLDQTTITLRKSIAAEVLVTLAMIHKPEGGWLRKLRIASDPNCKGTYGQLANLLRDAADDLEKLDQEEVN